MTDQDIEFLLNAQVITVADALAATRVLAAQRNFHKSIESTCVQGKFEKKSPPEPWPYDETQHSVPSDLRGM